MAPPAPAAFPCLALLLLAGGGARVARADGALEILGQLKGFRDASVALLSETSQSLMEAGQTAEADKIKMWNDNWLSILGISTGLTGLSKDYVMNYLGRSAYHDHNGPLIEAIKDAGKAFRDGKTFDGKVFRDSLLAISREGKKLFSEGGSIHRMLSELDDLMNLDGALDSIKKVMSEHEAVSSNVKAAFEYLAGPQQAGMDDDYDPELDVELDEEL